MFLNDFTVMSTHFNTPNIRVKSQGLGFDINKDSGIDSDQDYVFQKELSSFGKNKPRYDRETEIILQEQGVDG